MMSAFRIGVAIGEFAVEVVSKALELGTSIIDGLVNGITSGAAKVVEAVKSVARGAIGAAGAVLKIGSPSKVFEQIGAWTSEGFAGGIEAGSADVRTASSQMTGAALSGVAGGGGSSSEVRFSPTINVNVGGTNASGGEIAEAIDTQLRRSLVRIFDGMEPA